MKHAAVPALGIALAVLLQGPAQAQAFVPDRGIEFMVHTGPGAGSDIFARGIAGMLEKNQLVPQRITVVNKAGGGGLVGMSYLGEKKGDTHLVACFTSVWYVNPMVRKGAKFSMSELTPVARLILEPSVLTVRADSPFKNANDFIAAARKDPGKLKQSGGSITGRDNNTRLMIQKATGTEWQFISMKSGGERVAALLGGHVDIYIMEPAEALEQIRAGKIRVIATLMNNRIAGLPDVPTLGEQGIKVSEIPQPRGIVGPPAMPAAVKAYWEQVLGRLVKTPDWQEYLKRDHLEDGFLIGADLDKFSKEYTTLMRGILQEAGVKLVK
jgi:putative tricarboxylic transport membrane protein